MTELRDAIAAYRAALTEAEKRNWLREIWRIIKEIFGFPVPANEPDPDTATVAEMDASVDEVETAANTFEAGGG